MRIASVVAVLALAVSVVQADMPRFDPPDPRLEKKVTLEVNHAKLQDVAKSLTEQSGITIKAGTGERDWKVRERRVTIQAKELSAGKTLDEISRLLGFYVSREGKAGEWTYIIWQDKKARDLEAEMLTAGKEAAAQRVKDSRQAAIDTMEKALKMTPEEAMKLKDKDPWTAYLGGTQSGRAFAQLFSSMGSQFPTEYDLMMRGRRAYIPISGMPSGMQQTVNTALNSGFGKAFRQEAGEHGQGLSPHQLVFMPTDGFGDAEAGLMGMSGIVFITGTRPDSKPDNSPFGGGQPMSIFPIISPGANASKVFGEALLDIEAGQSLREVGERLDPKMRDPEFMAQSLAQDSPTEKNVPTDPELTREIEINADVLSKTGRDINGVAPPAQEKLLLEISRALGWPVLFESFNRTAPIGIFIKAGKQPAYKVLIALEKAGYKWERGNGTLRIRPADWAVRRSYEIPESYMAYYRDLLEKQGEFTLDDVAGIASSLSDDQISHTFVFDADLAFLVSALSAEGFGGPRTLLRLYASLNEQQKQLMDTEGGLPFGRLTDAQWDRLSEFITDRQGGVYVTDGSIRIKPLTEEEIKANAVRRTFEVTVQVQNEQEPRKISQMIYLPDKATIAARKEARKKAEEAAKAAQQKTTDQPGQ